MVLQQLLAFPIINLFSLYVLPKKVMSLLLSISFLGWSCMENGSRSRIHPINFRCRCEKEWIQDFFSQFAMKGVFLSFLFSFFFFFTFLIIMLLGSEEICAPLSAV